MITIIFVVAITSSFEKTKASEKLSDLPKNTKLRRAPVGLSGLAKIKERDNVVFPFLWSQKPLGFQFITRSFQVFISQLPALAKLLPLMTISLRGPRSWTLAAHD